jgi:hypothetical protein
LAAAAAAAADGGAFIIDTSSADQSDKSAAKALARQAMASGSHKIQSQSL